MVGRDWYSKSLASLHFWATNVGVVARRLPARDRRGRVRGRPCGHTGRRCHAPVVTTGIFALVAAAQYLFAYNAVKTSRSGPFVDVAIPPDALPPLRRPAHLAHLDPARRSRTDLVYDVIAVRDRPHVGAVRLTMTPRWSGPPRSPTSSTERGARRITQTGGGAVTGARTVDVAFRTTTGKDGAVASTLSSAVQPTSVSATAGAEPHRQPGHHVRRARRHVLRVHQVRRRGHVAHVVDARAGRDRGLPAGGGHGLVEPARRPHLRLGRPVEERRRRRPAVRSCRTGSAPTSTRCWSSIRAGRRRQHRPGRAEQRQLRRADLLGRGDVDVSEPAGFPSRRRGVGHRVPPPDAARSRGERARARLQRPVLPLERRRHRRPRRVPQLEPAALPHADPPAGRHRTLRLAVLPRHRRHRLAARTTGRCSRASRSSGRAG